MTGNFSNIAYKEAQKYGQIHLAASSADKNHTYIPQQSQLELDPEASYFYYCANNTIYGTEWQGGPPGGAPVHANRPRDSYICPAGSPSTVVRFSNRPAIPCSHGLMG